MYIPAVLEMNSPYSADPLTALQEHFGFSEFRPLQREIVDSILAGSDTFVLMPTGGGKSICYQLPALMKTGLTLVISPLIALMKDQVDRLVQNGIAATYINSTLPSEEIAARMQKLRDGEYRLLYLAPERLVTDNFLSFLGRLPLALFAIDEAHCISEWGHDFREDYRRLAVLRRRFPDVPIIAMTATANDRVRHDIVEQLGIGRNLQRFQASFDRDNLTYEVRRKLSGDDQLLSIIERHRDESGIIYCGKRDTCDELSRFLRQKGYNALPYHAGLDAATRTRNQEQFVRGDVDVVCATIAFGMGIDKPDIRYVVHHSLPKTMAGYYQETGRAGRDGLPAECILLYSPSDISLLEYFNRQVTDPRQQEIGRQYLEEMVDYATTGECRRRTILRHFGENYPEPNCDGCDNCRTPVRALSGEATWDATVPAQKFLSCVIRLKEFSRIAYVTGVLTGSQRTGILDQGFDKLPTYGQGREMSRSEWRNLMEGLIDVRMVRRDPNESEKISVTEKGKLWLKNRETLQLPVRRSEQVERAERVGSIPSGELWQQLRTVRKRLADQLDITPHTIFDDRVLLHIERRKPRTIPDLLQIEGISATKAYRYGRAFISEIERYQGREFSGGGRASWNSNRSHRRVPPSAYQTLELYMNGMTIDEIARARRVTRATITEHLQLLEDLGEISDMHFREGGATAPASSITGDTPDDAGRRPGNRGKPWKPNDDMLLRQKFAEGFGIPELAGIFMRTEGAIHSRLVRLRLIEE